jgi:membrane-associated phospholipid phosphatase
VQLFLFLNDLAGRWPWIDELFRFVYMATLPLLGTLLLARLTLFPKAPHDPSRSRVVLATAAAVVLCVLTMLAINGLASVLHLGVLSPRPYMTRRINLLIVEPQDNSFPAPEMMVAAVFAVALAGLGRRWAITAGLATLLLGVARMFCGSNYLIDVVTGALIGTAWAGLALSYAQAPLRNLTRTLQMSWSSALLGATFLCIYLGLTFQPRFAAKLHAPWAQPAAAAPAGPTANAAIKSARDARGALQEGEGVTEGEDDAHEAEVLALSKRSSLFLPDVEAFLKGRLSPRTKPFTLLDVEVAPVKAGNTSYRCAAVRFEIERNVPHLRQQVAECAARLVKMSFALDSRVQNVDVIAILRGDGKQIDGSDANFVGDEVPVFTASVERKNLVLKSPAPAWANSSTIDGGSWLRYRSLLFVNDKVLPDEAPQSATASPQFVTPTPIPPTPQVTPDLPPTPRAPGVVPVPGVVPGSGRPLVTPTARPTATPRSLPTATATAARATTEPTPRANPTLRPTQRATPTIAASPTPAVVPTAQPTPTRAPRPIARAPQSVRRPRVQRARPRSRKPVYRKHSRVRRYRRSR